MNNQLSLNPAFAGSKGYPSATFIHRKQWLDFEGAPSTQAFSMHSPVLRKNVGLGLVVENDKICVTNSLNVYGNYSYSLNLGNGNKISAGIRGGISHYTSVFSDPSKFRIWDFEDPVYASDRKVTVPNFGFGLYYSISDKFFAGVSIPKLMDYRKQPKYREFLNDMPKEQKHYYFTSGFTVNAGSSLKLKPSVLLRYVPAAPMQADVNLSAVLADALTIGASYRTGDAVIGMLGFQLNKRMKLGYSFDMTVSRLKNYSSNTHELLLGYATLWRRKGWGKIRIRPCRKQHPDKS